MGRLAHLLREIKHLERQQLKARGIAYHRVARRRLTIQLAHLLGKVKHL